MSNDRSIRRSQAIHPYGPGAILDWGQECFVMLDTSNERWLRAPEIRLERLERYLKVDRFRQPPLKRQDNPHVALPVYRFPRWLFCPKCNALQKWTQEDEREREVDREKLPLCKKHDDSGRRCGGTLVPMRYVAVCENGHMTDVDWHRWAHANTGRHGVCAKPYDLEFVAKPEKGSSLSALEVRCKKCGASNNLDGLSLPGALEKVGQRCFGQQPWQFDEGSECSAPLKPLLRSQTAVHFSSIVSALDLSVEELDEETTVTTVITERINVLRQSGDEREDFTPRKLKKIADWASQEVGREVLVELVENVVETVFGTEEIRANQRNAQEGICWTDFLTEEWHALTHANKKPGIRSPLVVSRSNWLEGSGSAGELHKLIDEVYLIERLREVRAFVGFRRLNTDGPLVRPNLSRDLPPNWLPATEVYGEGIFLKFSQKRLKRWESNNAEGIANRIASVKAKLEGEDHAPEAFLQALPVLARFIMVHTFSHLLMRQLCYECGYHGASIRERLYVFPDRAGVLIYTADGDSEGSLGGLVRQGRADRLGRTVAAALERGGWCSNDPICGELPPHGLFNSNRGACHACALVPETSCTHINSLLDRKMVISGGGDVGSHLEGFFQPVIDDLITREIG